jgi:hypothetical protein
VLAGVVLYAGSVLLSPDHSWKPKIPDTIKRLWRRMDPWNLVSVGSGFVFVGLVMTVVGIVWQWLPKRPEPQTLSIPATQAAAATPTIAKTDPSDVPKKLAIIDEGSYSAKNIVGITA